MRSISVRTLVRRINRRLAKEGSSLHVTRPGSRFARDLGAYHVVNASNFIEATLSDDTGLESYAREAGCLAADETILEAA